MVIRVVSWTTMLLMVALGLASIKRDILRLSGAKEKNTGIIDTIPNLT